jgi:hypothetical protein
MTFNSKEYRNHLGAGSGVAVHQELVLALFNDCHQSVEICKTISYSYIDCNPEKEGPSSPLQTMQPNFR